MKTWVETKASGIEHQVKNRKSRRPEGMDSSSDEEEDEVDMDLIRKNKKNNKFQRTSVSAEAYGMWNRPKAFTPKVISKPADLKQRISTRLQNAFMFTALEDKERTIVMDAMEEKVFEAGETVIQQGDDGDVLYVVDKGALDCEKTFPGDDKPSYLKTYVPGESFGELALLYNAPRAASIKAKERSVLYSLDRETFNHIVKDAAMKKREQYLDFLSKVSLLDELDTYEKTKICDCLQSQKFKPGDYVIREGEKGDTFFLIEEGEAYATKRDSKGEEKKVFEYAENTFFGEKALLYDQPRAASIISRVSVLSD